MTNEQNIVSQLKEQTFEKKINQLISSINNLEDVDQYN